jgi:hypothetical protein
MGWGGGRREVSNRKNLSEDILHIGVVCIVRSRSLVGGYQRFPKVRVCKAENRLANCIWNVVSRLKESPHAF